MYISVLYKGPPGGGPAPTLFYKTVGVENIRINVMHEYFVFL